MSRPSTRPPQWLMCILMLCLSALLAAWLAHPAGPLTIRAMPEVPTPTAVPTPAPAPSPTPESAPAPDYSLPVPAGEAVAAEWFDDAVFIGDSRTDGLHLFSGVSAKAVFLESTGLTVYEVMEGKEVIRLGREKVSVLDALAQNTCGKVYISLGVNELGYYDPDDFARVYGTLIDAVRECQPNARLYIQSIIPVNTAKCKANDVPYYVTNEGIASYNEALAALCAEKEVWRVDVDRAFADDTGEVPADLSADGVHFKKEGYALWLDYLATHTGT